MENKSTKELVGEIRSELDFSYDSFQQSNLIVDKLKTILANDAAQLQRIAELEGEVERLKLLKEDIEFDNTTKSGF